MDQQHTVQDHKSGSKRHVDDWGEESPSKRTRSSNRREALNGGHASCKGWHLEGPNCHEQHLPGAARMIEVSNKCRRGPAMIVTNELCQRFQKAVEAERKFREKEHLYKQDYEKFSYESRVVKHEVQTINNQIQKLTQELFDLEDRGDAPVSQERTMRQLLREYKGALDMENTILADLKALYDTLRELKERRARTWQDCCPILENVLVRSRLAE